MNSPNPLTRSRAKRLAIWLAVGIISAFTAEAPAAAVPSGEIYQARCYTICLYRESALSYRFTASTLFYDVGPTPYFISIFDAYSGERVAICGSGTECTSRELDLNCYELIAYIGGSGTSMPPEPVRRTSAPLYHCFGAG